MPSNKEQLAADVKVLQTKRIETQDELIKLTDEQKLKAGEFKQEWREAKLDDKMRRKNFKRNKKEQKLIAKAKKQEIKNLKNEIKTVYAEIKAEIKNDAALQAAAAQMAQNEINQLKEQNRLAELKKQQEHEKEALSSPKTVDGQSAKPEGDKRTPSTASTKPDDDKHFEPEQTSTEKPLAKSGSELKTPELKPVTAEATPGVAEDSLPASPVKLPQGKT